MKKLTAVILTAAVVLCTLTGCGGDKDNTALTTIEEPDGVEDELTVLREIPQTAYWESASDFAGGSGTAEDPWQISSASQLALLHEKMNDTTYANACYVLAEDIVLNDTADFESWAYTAPQYAWEPIGHKAAVFGGVFDGNGHTVKGMYINIDNKGENAGDGYCGLFANVSGVIKNLNMEQVYMCVSGDGISAGAVAGYLSSDNAIVSDCTIDAMIDCYGPCSIGGVVGKGGTVEACTFSGRIHQCDDEWGHLGGISGNASAITGCSNFGTISGKGYSGGISGWGGTIEACENRGSITGDTAGGICGNLYKTGTGMQTDLPGLIIRDSMNEGLIVGISVAGGIAGKVGNDEKDIEVKVVSCKNHGEVRCENASGIVGRLSVERASAICIEACCNYGKIIGNDKSGGIVCELTGGILKQMGAVRITDCENDADIIAEGLYSGGILTYFMLMGNETDLQLTLEECTNNGSVVSQNNAGGIVCFSASGPGQMDISESSFMTLRNCINNGKIVGAASNSYVGGIAAAFGVKEISALFENCVNNGDVWLELNLSEENVKSTLEDGAVMTLSQIIGGVVGRLGDGLLLTTDHDVGSADNIDVDDARIIFRDCHSGGALVTTDCSEITAGDGERVWKNYIGGIIGNTSAEDAYAFCVENCTYTGAERGLGNTEYSDIGTKK